MKRFKLWQTILAKVCVQIVFFVTSVLFHVNKKRVVFASYRAEKLEGNLYYVYKELQKRTTHYSCRFLFKKYRTSFIGKLDYFFHMLRAGYHLATSRYFFIDDYYFPVYLIKPRKNTEIIQLWHAAGAFKKFGYSTLNQAFGPSKDYLKHVKIHSNYSKVIVSSTEVIPYYSEAFRMPSEQILPLGVPRTDYFFKKDEHRKVKERFYQCYPELMNKKLILYAPTFRGKSHDQETFLFPIDIPQFVQILGEDYALLVHLHPYMKNQVKVDRGNGFIYHITEQFNIQELMVLSDVLVTDYSSVVFDYSLLERPMAFFADDLEEYTKERDFYYHYRSFIPGPFFTETEKLALWIKEGDFDRNIVSEFRKRFFDHADGKASSRIVERLFEETPEAHRYAKLEKGDTLAK